MRSVTAWYLSERERERGEMEVPQPLQATKKGKSPMGSNVMQLERIPVAPDIARYRRLANATRHMQMQGPQLRAAWPGKLAS